MSVLRPDLMMKCVIPVIMAGIIAVSTGALRYLVVRLLRSQVDLRSRRVGFDFWRAYVRLRVYTYMAMLIAFVVDVRMPLYQGFVQLGAGLSVGLAGLAAGFAIGIVGDAGVRGTAQQPRLFVGMVRNWVG